jgi:hypothetical protein
METNSTSPKRVGYYCWAGPGTVRMLNLKFFDPKINHSSLMQSYDYDYLARVQETFNITDVWATYSWGFSPKVEKEDYEFILSRLDNFHKLGLKVHAYVQGTNLVYEDFKDKDWFSQDNFGRRITYYRGRHITCVNNPGFLDFMANKVAKITRHGFDGVFIDNIIMGQMPLSILNNNLPFVFAGCNCEYCRKSFKAETGHDIPLDFEKNKKVTEIYLKFRTQSTYRFIHALSQLASKKYFEFGTNSYDPRFNSDFMFGFNLKQIEKSQDYLLFESLTFPSRKSNPNYDINEFSSQTKKPVFCVSYKKGIGRDKEYTQNDFNNLFSEKFSFYPCIKGSEYFTNNTWHNLKIEKYKKPQIHEFNRRKIKSTKALSKTVAKILTKKPVKNFLKQNYNPILTLYMENKLVRKLFDPFYTLALKSHS